MRLPTESWRRLKLAPKLHFFTVIFFVLVALILSLVASVRLEKDLSDAFQAQGVAVGRALAAAAEQSAVGNPLILQNTIEGNRVQRGVKYLFVLDSQGEVVGTTLLTGMPPGLKEANLLPPGVDQANNREKIGRVRVGDGDRELRVIDVAVPVRRGTLGIVHVGMDSDAIEAQVMGLRYFLWSLGGLLALAGVIFSLRVTHVVAIRPVRDLTRITSEIVSRGDLTQLIAVQSEDEIGQLAKSFAQMVEKLREIPKRLNESVRMLGESVTHLSASAAVQSDSLVQQATALEQTQATVQEISRSSTLAAEKASAVLQHSQKVDQVAQSGDASVAKTLSALTDIREQVIAIAARITDLAGHAEVIGTITASVRDVADRTNLLALNAAIEAAQAGEAGLGFAVVAQEMRSLATQSLQATRQVQKSLGAVVGAITAAVKITESGAQRIDAGLEQVKASGERFGELSAIVRDNSAMVGQISSAVSQQNAGIAQITAALAGQSELMNQSMKRLEMTSSAVKTLEEVSRTLTELVCGFKVEDSSK